MDIAKKLRIWATESDIKVKASLATDLKQAADEVDRLRKELERALNE